MEERQVRELLDRLIATMDPAEEYEARHEDYSVEFPFEAPEWRAQWVERITEPAAPEEST
jgi:hypothetical protein